MFNAADLIEMRAVEQARRSFWAYRQYIHPKLKKGWWQRETAHELQQFFEDLKSGQRPMLVIQAPPQHGKSEQIVDLISWIAGHNPDLRTIYTSYSDRLGIRANLKLQRIYDSDKYKRVFPETRINSSNVVTISGQYLRNREIIEYVGREGGFRNTTVRGSITGESLDLGVIDDPIKGREEAGSLTIRDKTWDWLLDDFLTRFSENAGLLAILTRWHVDDPIGRLIERMPGVKVLSYPAIATQDEPHRKIGEPLFPEHKSLEFLLERKAVMANANWEALYQQNPMIVGGDIIKTDWFKRYTALPKIQHRTIYADTAQKTKERNDYSVFECWGKGDDNRIYLLDLIRGKWEAPELRRRAVDFWNKHNAVLEMGALRAMRIEDKASGTGLIQEVRLIGGVSVDGIERVTDKLTRVMDVVGHIESGNVCLPEESPWVSDFLAECEAFTADDSHAHDDQIDPMCDAINDLLGSQSALATWERLAG